MDSPADAPERPADPAVRKANTRRIVRLFRPYRLRLGAVCSLIFVSAVLGALPAFLLREVLDVAIPDENVGLLTVLVAAMIAISVITGVLGVWQTLLSNQVGQSVMHDLRTQVYRHLQRLSLAFFTRTRTGEVQSRIANDIGGIENVVTSTATSVLANVTTVLASVVAMFLLDWRLAVFALALLPLFVWLTKRVSARSGRRSSPSGRRLSPTCPRSSRSRSRCPGSCSARRWGAPATWPSASRPSPLGWPPSRCAAG